MRTFEMPFQTTRGALEQTLVALGYRPTYGKNELGFPFVAYRHDESGASVAMRSVPASEALDPVDCLASEHSVEWWGIADHDTFYRLLREATPGKSSAPVKVLAA
ncbi:MAG: hypothetical protein ACLQVD_14830 [Capsulimonadaceae bacterium]